MPLHLLDRLLTVWVCWLLRDTQKKNQFLSITVSQYWNHHACHEKTLDKRENKQKKKCRRRRPLNFLHHSPRRRRFWWRLLEPRLFQISKHEVHCPLKGLKTSHYQVLGNFVGPMLQKYEIYTFKSMISQAGISVRDLKLDWRFSPLLLKLWCCNKWH